MFPIRLNPSASKIVAATLLISVLSGDLLGQESDQSAEQILQLIKDVGSQDSTTYRAARSTLREIGEKAIGPLKAALNDAGPVKQIRIKALLKQLEANTVERRLAELMTAPTPQSAERFSQWGRFADIVGSDREAIDLFIRLVKAEPQLFGIADGDVGNLREPLLKRSAELAGRSPSERFSVDSFAAVLFLASNNEVSLRGATSYYISGMLTDDFKPAVVGKDGANYLKLAGAWILRRNINTAGPLEFAIANPMPEGLLLARKTLKGVLRKPAGQDAMSLIEKQGDKSDIALLESLFDPEHPDYNEARSRTHIFKARPVASDVQYVCCFGDWALAVAIRMQGKHPFEFGFVGDANNMPPNEFVITEGSAGFKTEDAREAAVKKYQATFKTR